MLSTHPIPSLWVSENPLLSCCPQELILAPTTPFRRRTTVSLGPRGEGPVPLETLYPVPPQRRVHPGGGLDPQPSSRPEMTPNFPGPGMGLTRCRALPALGDLGWEVPAESRVLRLSTEPRDREETPHSVPEEARRRQHTINCAPWSQCVRHQRHGRAELRPRAK